jgi:hypothetical protein
MREPYEMTYQEFFRVAGSEYVACERFGLPGNRVPIKPVTGYREEGATPEERIHRSIIRKAITDGKQIPERVMEQYPDLR